jgi:hypothetical protein
MQYLSIQVGVGIGTTAPHASAALENTDTTKGLLVPKMKAANNIIAVYTSYQAYAFTQNLAGVPNRYPCWLQLKA